jgi:hypothetical protein
VADPTRQKLPLSYDQDGGAPPRQNMAKPASLLSRSTRPAAMLAICGSPPYRRCVVGEPWRAEAAARAARGAAAEPVPTAAPETDVAGDADVPAEPHEVRTPLALSAAASPRAAVRHLGALSLSAAAHA